MNSKVLDGSHEAVQDSIFHFLHSSHKNFPVQAKEAVVRCIDEPVLCNMKWAAFVDMISSDSNAPLIDEYENTNLQGSTERGLPHGEQALLRRQSTWSSLATKAKRAKAYDKLKYDPRAQSSPYFLHSPILVFHRPPYTLRYGGNFKAPVAALLHVTLGWRKWKLEFGDVLSQEGVVDGRGVVSLDYGTKNGEDGTLKGYRLRSFRFPGETGKAWFKQRKALGDQNTETRIQSTIKAKPEEVVELRWASPLLRPREYVFFWRGFKFIWKGTGKAQARKVFRPILRLNHLKLVVLIPQIIWQGEKDVTQLTLARFTSVMGYRKSGRLEVFQDTISTFLAEHIPDADAEDLLQHVRGNEKQIERFESLGSESLPQKESSKLHQRISDIIVATAMSMVIGERQKRQTIIAIIRLALDLAPK